MHRVDQAFGALFCVAGIWLIPRSAFAHCPECAEQAASIVLGGCLVVATTSAWLSLRRANASRPVAAAAKHFLLVLLCSLVLGIFAVPVLYLVIGTLR